MIYYLGRLLSSLPDLWPGVKPRSLFIHKKRDSPRRIGLLSLWPTPFWDPALLLRKLSLFYEKEERTYRHSPGPSPQPLAQGGLPEKAPPFYQCYPVGGTPRVLFSRPTPSGRVYRASPLPWTFSIPQNLRLSRGAHGDAHGCACACAHGTDKLPVSQGPDY